jgi:D-sedoheptulose 7-phosphate isomerase
LKAARELGLLAVGFCGWEHGGMPECCDFCFSVPSFNVHRILETHETLLHAIWDVVYVLRGEQDVL